MRTVPDAHEARHEVLVTEAMTVDFEQTDPKLGRLHPVYATYWLVKHAELVSRKLVLPYLEPDEEGIGHEVHMRHLASALPGMRVVLTARFRLQEGNRVYADVHAESPLGDVVGIGSTTQVILPRSELEAGFDRLRARWAGPTPTDVERER